MEAQRKRSDDEEFGTRNPYDLTEEAGKRGGDAGAADEARKRENDDVNEETNLGFVSTPEGDSAGENRVTTSLSED